MNAEMAMRRIYGVGYNQPKPIGPTPWPSLNALCANKGEAMDATETTARHATWYVSDDDGISANVRDSSDPDGHDGGDGVVAQHLTPDDARQVVNDHNSAPALLAACRMAKAGFGVLSHHTDGPNKEFALVEFHTLSAAIAQATGQAVQA